MLMPHLCYFVQGKNFYQKKGFLVAFQGLFRHFLGLLNPNFMRKLRKSNEAILRKRCYRWTEGWTDRGEFIALNYRVTVLQ